MIIYKADGSVVNNPNDVDFGWTITEIPNTEDSPSCLETSIEVSLKLLPKSELQDDTLLLHQKSSAFPSTELPTIIEIEEASSIEDPSPFQKPHLDVNLPAKIQLAKLINPCTTEAKMLLSIVDNHNKDTINVNDLINISKLKFLMKKTATTEDSIRDQIRNHQTKNQVFSILLEVISAEAELDVRDAVGGCGDSTDGARSLNESKFELLKVGHCFGSDTQLFLQSLEKVYEEFCKIYMETTELKKSFQEEEARVDLLIDNAKILERDLRETQFLDKLIFLLEGQVERVVFDQSPFRIFLPHPDQEELNLIV